MNHPILSGFADGLRGAKNSVLVAALLACSLLLVDAQALDTEIYVATNPAAQKRPKVLIIFDNSGSMSTLVEGTGETRLQIAKRVVSELIDDNTGIDFGLAVYNFNASEGSSPRNGGRIVRGLSEGQSAADHANIKNTITSLGPDTWTPLCETVFEAYRYLTGQRVVYGDDDPNAVPPRDTSVESNGRYISPLGECEQAYVILMTDGLPTRDTDADGAVASLSGIGALSGSRLNELTKWLYENDIDPRKEGEQRVVTYTIGFMVDDSLLKDAADNAGGRAFTAADANQLRDAFKAAVAEILDTPATFTSPTVAVNSFNRSRSLNDVYFAMFEPQAKPRWSGNIKKLRMTADGTLVDADGLNAIDPQTGHIRERARTFWSSGQDGAQVESGGVGGLLAARNPASRGLWVDTGVGGTLEPLDASNANLTAAMFDAADDQELAQLISWARGADVDDLDRDTLTGEARSWILGDPLHSRPLVLNYGARGGATKDNPDTRIVVGTNAGFLHMFNGASGQEDWAFMPKDLAPLQKVLRRNSAAVVHPYGVDGTAVAYVYDKNRDGTITAPDDKVYIYFGMRRGGTSYYGLDVSTPERPRLLWKIDSQSPGMGELGQSWSAPVVAQIQGVTDPVLIFAAGYDTNKDLPGVGTADSRGRGIFIANAVTGALLWSATPAANSATNYSVPAMTDSIPAQVTALDSDGDGRADRVYVGDTSGNIWRVDMPGKGLPSSAQNTWSVFKFASLGGDTPQSDRRFFNQIDVVQTRDAGVNYDAVALGSGNRAHPNDLVVQDRFFMLRDLATNTQFFGTGGTPVPAALTDADLYDATGNALQTGSEAAKNALADREGWYLSLGVDADRRGEKVLASSVTLGGTLFFASFVPNATVNLCKPPGGTAYLFGISLHDATAAYDWSTSNNSQGQAVLTAEDRSVEIGTRLPDTVTPHFGEDEIRIVGMGAGDQGKGSNDTGVQLQTLGTYWYRATE